MDSFNFGNLKAEKANAMMMKQRQLRKIANLFRFVEVCVVLVLISRISIQLPVAVKNSGDYFRGFSVFVVSPQFVFVIGNVIIITLFAQSGQFSSQGSKSKTSEPDLYQHFIKNSTKNLKIKEKQSLRTEDEGNNRFPEKQSITTEDGETNENPEKQSIRTRTEDEEIKEYQEKQSMRLRTEESMKKQINEGGKIKWVEKQCVKTGDRKCLDYRRCETEKLRDFQREKPRSLLRRSETEKSRSYLYPQDSMSNDEFRRTVEAFIARQQRLRWEEEYSGI